MSNKCDNFQQGTRSTVQRLGESFASGFRQVPNRQTLKRFFDRLQQIRHHTKSYDMHHKQTNKAINVARVTILFISILYSVYSMYINMYIYIYIIYTRILIDLKTIQTQGCAFHVTRPLTSRIVSTCPTSCKQSLAHRAMETHGSYQNLLIQIKHSITYAWSSIHYLSLDLYYHNSICQSIISYSILYNTYIYVGFESPPSLKGRNAGVILLWTVQCLNFQHNTAFSSELLAPHKLSQPLSICNYFHIFCSWGHLGSLNCPKFGYMFLRAIVAWCLHLSPPGLCKDGELGSFWILCNPAPWCLWSIKRSEKGQNIKQG